jgi:hypothetical protein
MKVSDSIKYSLPENLPNGLSIIEQGKRVSPDITIGTTLFFTENNVRSEIDFKQKMINERRITFNMQYGLANLEKSVEGRTEKDLRGDYPKRSPDSQIWPLPRPINGASL